MSHGRTLCICGRVVMQCRCPSFAGGHVDTVKAGPCTCPEVALPPLADRQAKALDYAVANLSNCMRQHEDSGLCLPCSNRKFATEALIDLRGDLVHTEAALLEARTQRDGANNRVKYLENLIKEIVGKAGIL